MAGILDLPVETLIEIFCLLEDFDDVFHLSRSCRRLYIPIETEMDYKKIMKSIIVSKGLSGSRRPIKLICLS